MNVLRCRSVLNVPSLSGNIRGVAMCSMVKLMLRIIVDGKKA